MVKSLHGTIGPLVTPWRADAVALIMPCFARPNEDALRVHCAWRVRHCAR